jgi:tetratricopeptide (TPR) repeat protein
VGLLVIAAIVSTVLATWAIQAQRTAELALQSERAARQDAESAKQRAEQASQRLSQATQLTTDGIEYYARNNWHAAHERFTRAMQIEPGLNTPYIYRGALYTRLGLWDKAAADYDRRFQLAKSANAETWFDYLLLKVYSGDESGYRQACQEMLRQHNASAEVRHRYCVVRSCLLTSKPVGDADEVVRRAETLAASASAPWYVGIAGRAHLLAGNYEQAEARCREAIKLGGGSPRGVHRVNFANLALALHHQGKTAEAKNALAVADNAKDQWTTAMQNALDGTRPLNWCDWLEFLHFHREATMSITGAPPAADSRLAAIYDRALATVTFGDVFTHMDAGRQHVRQQSWDQAAASFVEVLDKLPPGFRGASPEMRFCVEMVHTPAVFDRLVKLRPANHHLWNARAYSDASSREWNKAAAAMRKTLELVSSRLSSDDPPNRVSNWYNWCGATSELGALLLLAGDELAYRELCSSILETPGMIEDSVVRSCASRACTMSPDAVTDFTKPLQWALYAVQQQPRPAWHVFALGIAQHRSGRHEEAIQSFQRSLTMNKDWVGRGQNYASLALACNSLGRDQEARQWLNETRSWLNEVNRNAAGWKFGFAASDFLGDWLIAQVLLREAETVLGDGDKF